MFLFSVTIKDAYYPNFFSSAFHQSLKTCLSSFIYQKQIWRQRLCKIPQSRDKIHLLFIPKASRKTKRSLRSFLKDMLAAPKTWLHLEIQLKSADFGSKELPDMTQMLSLRRDLSLMILSWQSITCQDPSGKTGIGLIQVLDGLGVKSRYVFSPF
jgi:hypothetical protein